MPDTLPEAKIRVVIDTADADRQVDKAEKNADAKESRGRRLRKEKKKKDARAGRLVEGFRQNRFVKGGRKFQGTVGSFAGGGVGGGLAKLGAIGLIAAVVLQVVEQVIPIVTSGIKEAAKDKGEIGELLAGLVDDAFQGLAQKVSALEAIVGAGFGAAKASADLERARIFLGGGTDVTNVSEFVADYYQVLKAQGQAERERRRVGRKVFGANLVKLLKGE